MGKNELEAVIWDMDGVLTNTNEFHFQAWRKIYQRFSDDRQPLVRARFEAVFGMSNDETIVRLFGTDHDSTAFIERVGVEKETLFREMIRGRLEPMPAVLSWLTYFQDHGRCQAVASSAPKLNVEAILSELRMACLAVTTTHHTSDLIDADWVIDNFVDLQPRTMLEMWSSWHTL